jgi:CHAT domain-containing protein/tetratricopeptide (TPR) repeat protein
MPCVSNNGRWNFSVSDIASFLRCAAAAISSSVIVLLLGTAACFAQNQPEANRSLDHPRALVLMPGKSVERTLAPHESVILSVPVHAGLFNEVHVQQIHGMTQSYLIGPDGHDSLPHFNDGGIGSVERIPFIPAQSGTLYLRIESRERHTPVIFQATRVQERVPQPRDQDIVQAESALTEAEYIRHRTGFHDTPKMQSSTHTLALYDRAYYLAEQAADGGLARESLIGKARYQIFGIAEYQQGVETAKHATQISASIGDIDQQALAWKTLASALAFINHYDASIDASQHAIALYRDTGDLYWQGIVLGNLADTYREIGKSGRALKAAKEALQLAQQLSDDYGVAYTQATLGEIYLGRGQYQQAIDAYDAAIATARIVGYPQVEGEVWNDLGQLYAKLGDWDRAKDAYIHALPILHKDGDGINEIQVLGHLGELALHASQPRQAQQYFREGLMRARRQDLVREETFLESGLARACLKIDCPENPLQTLYQAQHEAQQIHLVDGEAAIDAAIGDVLAHRLDDSGAMQAYSRSAALWQQIPNSSELAAVEAGMARLDVRRGQLQLARLQIYKALDAIEASRAHIDSDALRTSYFTSRHGYYDTAVDILMRLDNVLPNHGYAEQAWTVAERARARTLLDQLLQMDSIHASASSKLIRQKRAALELKIHDAEEKLSSLGSTSADIFLAKQLQRKIHDMLLQEDELEANLRASNPAYHALLEESQMSPASLGNTVLTDGTALVEYWLGQVHSYLWIVTANGMQSFCLPDRRSLDGLVHSYQQSMLARDKFVAGEDMQARLSRIQQSDAQLSQQSKKLAAILLPKQFSPDVHQLLIVADGSLLSVPFAALELPDLHAGPPRYLIQRYDLVYEPSAFAAVSFLSRRAQDSGRSRIAIFADPVYSITDVRLDRNTTTPAVHVSRPVLRAASFESLSGLPRLPGSRKEAIAIEQIAGVPNTSMFLGFDASPEKVEEIDWKSYAMVHFAAHAVVDTEHPELSGIVLSMFHPNGSPADGVLWLHDIYRLEMPVSLVSLSGCDTAEGKSIPGEGINGLARAFLYAGARSVIGTLWDAEDTSSSEMMQGFYRMFLRQHLAAAASLRAAQLRVLSDGSHQAPYYWAGFILEGDWRGR